MKSMADLWRIALGILAVVAIGVTLVTCWPAIRFALELQQAMDKHVIEKVMVILCPLTREILLESKQNDAELTFYKNIQELPDIPDSSGGCYKQDFGSLSSELVENGKLHFTAEDIAEIRSSIDTAYFVHSSRSMAIVSDAVFFYVPEQQRIYVVNYWQTGRSVSLMIIDESSEKSLPILRSGIWPNKFTNTLYDKFMLGMKL